MIYHWLCHVFGKWDHFLAFMMTEECTPFFYRSRICVTHSIQERLDTKLSYTGDAHKETDVREA